jgi:hypothetical protein
MAKPIYRKGREGREGKKDLPPESAGPQRSVSGVLNPLNVHFSSALSAYSAEKLSFAPFASFAVKGFC